MAFQISVITEYEEVKYFGCVKHPCDKLINTEVDLAKNYKIGLYCA